MTCQDADDSTKKRRKTPKKQGMLELVQLLERHARTCLRVPHARGAVSCLHPPPLTRESLLPASAILEQNSQCALYSCHSVDDHQVVEEDDAEGGHHTQPILRSTVHEAGFP